MEDSDELQGLMIFSCKITTQNTGVNIVSRYNPKQEMELYILNGNFIHDS